MCLPWPVARVTFDQRRSQLRAGSKYRHLEQGFDDVPLDALHGLSSVRGGVGALVFPPHSRVEDNLYRYQYQASPKQRNATP